MKRGLSVIVHATVELGRGTRTFSAFKHCFRLRALTSTRSFIGHVAFRVSERISCVRLLGCGQDAERYTIRSVRLRQRREPQDSLSYADLPQAVHPARCLRKSGGSEKILLIYFRTDRFYDLMALVLLFCTWC